MDLVLQFGLVGVVGFLAGAVNTLAGGGTLLVYPALLACGLSPVGANITSLIGLTPGYVGGVYAYRREIRGDAGLIPVLGPAALIGAVAGAVVLLVTPGDVFELVVPYLVLASSLLLAGQPWLNRWLSPRGPVSARRCTFPVLTVASVIVGGAYGAYFSAGVGVLLLALLGATLKMGFQRLNGLKGALSLIIVAVGVCIYVFSGHVRWLYALILLPCSGIGGLIGGKAARRLNADVLRYTVCALGLGLSVYLLLV